MSNELLINNPKSNNAEDMSNKQIEEMSAEIQKAVNGCSSYWSGLIADALYEADYRKQSKGEWIVRGLANPKCSICGKYADYKDNYGPYCGAKMKGGE